MKSLPPLFFGIFFTIAFSWTGIVLTTHLQLRDLDPVSTTMVNAEGEEIAGVRYVDAQGNVQMGFTNPNELQWPQIPAGMAERGKDAYVSLGCVYCHSQQVRRKGFGNDWERGWGDRQSVPRDYIRQKRVLLGTMRTGPDLMNVGQRIPTAEWHHLHLYNPRITSEGSIMPSYTFLYEEREIGPDGPSPYSLQIPDVLPGGDATPEFYLPREGYEIVPTQRGNELVAYLLSLRLDYELPEAKFTQE